jgi:hypothetical protein
VPGERRGLKRIGSLEVLAQVEDVWVCADGLEGLVERHGDGAEVTRWLPAAAVGRIEHDDLAGQAQARQRQVRTA